MGEIKSTLDLVLEKTRHLSQTSEEKQAQFFEPQFHMAKQPAVTGIDQDPGRAVNKIGIAVVGRRRLPDKCMQIRGDFHQVFSLC